MVFPWLAAAVVASAGASLFGAKKQADAAKDAANIGAQSTQQQLQMQRDAYANADRILTPYSQEGAQARRMYNALLGVGTADAAPAQPLQTGLLGSSQTGSMELDDFIAANPGLRQYWSSWETGKGSGRHRVLFGDFNGYALDEFQKSRGRAPAQGGYAPDAPQMGTVGATDRIAADREAALSVFRASPYSTIARDSAQRGTNALFSTAAAMGRGVNSGKTQRAASDWNNTAQNNALVSFMGSLGGVADTGYNADSGRASGGQTFANNASNALAAQANAQAQGRLGSANAWAQGLSNAAGFIGWGAGQMGGGQNALFYQQPQTRTTPGAPTGIYGPR